MNINTTILKSSFDICGWVSYVSKWSLPMVVQYSNEGTAQSTNHVLRINCNKDDIDKATLGGAPGTILVLCKVKSS